MSTQWQLAMLNRLRSLSQPPVLSLGAIADNVQTPRPQSQLEVLIRHLLHRFVHNELLASDDETKRIMQVSYAVALPGLLFAMFLFPAYHAFPPYPFPRPFWQQVGDHYFYVMYTLVLMGVSTVYEWDLLFPDLLDVFVLSILPISNRRLFFARIFALAIFLGLVLVGVSILGTIALPLIAEAPRPISHLLAHATAVMMSGTFAAATFLALQGLVLNLVGDRLFRRISPFLQGASLMLMLTLLLLYPLLSRSLEPLLTSGDAAVRCFPPFWFLGIYERLLNGPTVAPIFSQLARTGCSALAVVLALTFLTYPLAYRRRVRQIIEGSSSAARPGVAGKPLNALLNTSSLHTPAERSTFHFISQTLLRSQRHRVMLAMYGGLGLALTLANMLVLERRDGHLRPALLPFGIRAAIPIVTFWTVTGLRSVIAAPVDRRGTWLFRVLVGCPTGGHLAGPRLWITSWALVVSLGTAGTLHFLSPPELRSPLITVSQFLVAAALSVLLSDLLTYRERVLPLTRIHKSSITDFPLMIFRYFVVFPLFVALTIHAEASIELNVAHLLGATLLCAGLHLLLRYAQARSLAHSRLDTSPDEGEDFPQSLGLRNT